MGKRCAKLLYGILSSQESYKVLLFPFYFSGKWHLWFIQGHDINKLQKKDLNLGLCDYKDQPLNHYWTIFTLEVRCYGSHKPCLIL